MSKSPKYLVRCSNINKKSDITGGPFRGRYHLSEDGAPESKESKTASCFAVHHGDRGPTIGHVGTVMVNPSGDSEKIIGQIPSTISAASVNISRDTAQQDSSDSVKVSLTDTDGKPVEDYLYHLKKYRSINARNYIIGHLNINSIRYKFDAVQSLLQDGLLDTLTISESKLDESFPSAQFKVTDFSLHRRDRDRHGGGLLLYIRSGIPHRRWYDIEPEISHGIEIMIIETRLYKAEIWFLVSVYKPHKIKDRLLEMVFTDICQSLQKESPHWFILGDMNLDMNVTNSLRDVSMVFDLTNLVDGPTCFKGDTPSSVDVLLSSEPQRFKCALNTRCSLNHFHNMTCVATKLHKPKTIYYRSYKTFDDETFINDVQNIPFSVCDVFDDVDDRLWRINKLFSDITDKKPLWRRRLLKNHPCLIGTAV